MAHSYCCSLKMTLLTIQSSRKQLCLNQLLSKGKQDKKNTNTQNCTKNQLHSQLALSIGRLDGTTGVRDVSIGTPMISRTFSSQTCGGPKENHACAKTHACT